VTWLAVWLAGVGLADLVRAVDRPAVSRWALPAGAATVVVLGGLAGLTAPVDVVVLLAALVPLGLWLRYSARSLQTGTGHGAALAWLSVGAVWCVAPSGWASEPGGVLERWLRWADLPAVGGAATPGRVLLVVGLVLANLATANVVVRLVLVSVGALRPVVRAEAGVDPEPADQLRGGRLLGPMERLVILGLGLAGQLTAAGLVIAAKGLIRFPELQAKRSETTSIDGVGIDEVTEYFLVGSFVSWLLALGSLTLTR
jgi:hypothetical protein